MSLKHSNQVSRSKTPHSDSAVITPGDNILITLGNGH
eukprot:CAMPEP_0202426834 /NCGR_PEP_ID=MMETSP1345-20130828/1144_1 /ASSEMBLY_ACC=CAM_ASM_000843 /TAXON_ID=342563 /ORGANISM="Fabrea Fabrea salina" /LENGTH=36 /DNA_ID= /DNA_START= /DNA_END= /DNA_ORIENTATION=